jgi:hypothetical protein
VTLTSEVGQWIENGPDMVTHYGQVGMCAKWHEGHDKCQPRRDEGWPGRGEGAHGKWRTRRDSGSNKCQLGRDET